MELEKCKHILIELNEERNYSELQDLSYDQVEKLFIKDMVLPYSDFNKTDYDEKPDIEDITVFFGSRVDLVEEFYRDGIYGECSSKLEKYIDFEAMANNPWMNELDVYEYCEEFGNDDKIVVYY